MAELKSTKIYGDLTVSNDLDVGGDVEVSNSIYFSSEDKLDGLKKLDSSHRIAIFGGTEESDGAYFSITGIDYSESPGKGSVSIVIGTETGAGDLSSEFSIIRNGLSAGDNTWTRYLKVEGSTGNVGIGVLLPSYKLHVAGTLGISNHMEMTGGNRIITSTAGYAMLRSNTSHIYLRAQGSSGAVYMSSGGTTTRLFIGSNGFVGIGTTSPDRQLHVVGHIRGTNTIRGDNVVAAQRNSTGGAFTTSQLRWVGVDHPGQTTTPSVATAFGTVKVIRANTNGTHSHTRQHIRGYGWYADNGSSGW